MIEPVLDKLKSMTTSYRFKTLHLYIVCYFCHILEKTVFQDFLFNNLSFKLEIDLVFVKKFLGLEKYPEMLEVEHLLRQLPE